MTEYYWHDEPNDRFRVDAEGRWERDYAEQRWRVSDCDWSLEVNSGHLLPVNSSHTPADLAMALELAGMMEYSWPDEVDGSIKDVDVANWIRAQVISTLYEGAR